MRQVFIYVLTATSACFIPAAIFSGAYPVTSAHGIGQTIGGALVAFIIGSIVALVARFFMSKERQAGGGGSIIGALTVAAYSALFFIGAAAH